MTLTDRTVAILLLSCLAPGVGLTDETPGPDRPVTVATETDDQLLASLKQDFESLLKGDPNAREMRKAERLLAETNGSDRWTSYMEAIKIIRRTRSKAAIPLLLRYMVIHTELASAGADGEYLDTINLLTGEQLPNPYRYVADRVTPMRQGVRKITQEWWRPNRDTITTDLDLVTSAGMERILEDVLTKARRDEDSHNPSPDEYQSAYRLYHAMFYGALQTGRAKTPPELRPRMLPLLLKKAGFRSSSEEGIAEPQRVPLEIVPLLAALRRDGHADSLDEIAADENQATTTRLVAILSLHAAGEPIDFPTAAAILHRERRLHQRLIAIFIFLKCTDRDLVANAILPLLKDRNSEVRGAAVYVIRATRPPAGLDSLARLLDERPLGTDIGVVLDGMAAYGNDKAKRTIAAFLERALREGDHDDVYKAIGPFATVTGQTFYEAGAHHRDYYVEQARKAIVWWKQSLRDQENAVAAAAAKETEEIRQAMLDGANQILEAKSLRDGKPIPAAITSLLASPQRIQISREPFADAADRLAGKLSVDQQKRLILFGNAAALDREGLCCTAIAPGQYGISLVAHFETDTRTLVFLWLMPEE